MRQFAVIALLGASTFAQWMELPVQQGSYDYTKYVKSQNYSTASVTGSGIEIGMNNNIFIQNSQTEGSGDSYKPGIRGGSIAYDVDLSAMDCGCVAGLYLVEYGDGCTQDSLDTNFPQCKTIDVMQANKGGFNVAMNPCNGGSCDAISQCQLNMSIQGKEQYGDDAYGPGGTLIDTSEPFRVHTEFMATGNYSTLWGLRTTLTQG